jgi:nucleotide-binding universal stress UspA family protein
MLRSILVALDDTPGAAAARDHAIALARRTGASLTAAVVLDQPHTSPENEFVPLGGGAFKARRDAARAARLAADAAAALDACAAAAGDLPFDRLELPDAPEAALLKAGAIHDLVVIGRDSTLGMEENEDGVAPVIVNLLQDGARPLLVVPPAPHPGRGPALVGYDGSLPCQAALQLFALLGLAEGDAVTVASAAETRAAAEALAEEGAMFLRRHGIAATALPLEGDRPADLLLAEAEGLDARLMVLGAYEESSFLRLLTGSATNRLLARARVPVFIHR